jgi:hypothetical protein
MQNNTDQESSLGQAKAKPEVIKLGLDLHARQVTECRQLDGSTPKPVQQWDPWKLLDQVQRWDRRRNPSGVNAPSLKFAVVQESAFAAQRMKII